MARHLGNTNNDDPESNATNPDLAVQKRRSRDSHANRHSRRASCDIRGRRAQVRYHALMRKSAAMLGNGKAVC